jgi:hypothetical protein
MSEPVKIICPHCYSADLNMYMQGLSGTGGGTMSMPAGNVTTNNMELKCNACGHIFKPGDGKLSQEAPAVTARTMPVFTASNPDILENANAPDPYEVMRILQTHGKLNAVKFVKDNTGWGLKASKDYVERLEGGNSRPGKKGCFIATACYGDYDAPEVRQLRLYRDQVLSASMAGRLLINVYYRCAPPLARWLSRSEHRRQWVRYWVLGPLLRWTGR